MWQKQQQVGSHMACALFVNLVEWKVWKRHSQVCWTKITIIYNFRSVYQTKDIQPWSESLKSVQVWVIKKSNNCALAHCSCKSTAGNFDRHVTDIVAVEIIFDKNSYHRSLKLVVAALASVRADFGSSRLRFGSKYSTPSWIFCKYRIIGVSWHWFPRPRRLKNRLR